MIAGIQSGPIPARHSELGVPVCLFLTPHHISPPMSAGIHSGSITSGIVGLIRRRYCLFGNTMNMAARTESSCPPGCVQLTDAAYALCAPHLPSGVRVQCRGPVEVKGAAEPIVMYLLSSTAKETSRSAALLLKKFQ